MKNRRIPLVIYTLVSLVLVVVSYRHVDIPIAKFFRYSNETIQSAFEIITLFGFQALLFIAIPLLLIGLVMLFVNKNWKYTFLCLFAPLNMGFAYLVGYTLKGLFARYRPIKLFEEELFGFNAIESATESLSFPSSHTVLITSFMYAVCLVKPKWKWYCFSVIFIIGFSRIVLTKHYLSDVIFGFLVGVLATELLYFITKKLKAKKHLQAQ